MTNQARRGARAENAVGDLLGEYGYDVIRSAASKGAADLVAIHDALVLLVQVKLGRDEKFAMPAPAERRELVRIAARIHAVPLVACRVPGTGGRPPVTGFRALIGTGPKDWEPWNPEHHT